VRRFRGAIYDIQLHNPGHVCRGVEELSVDGLRVESSLVPLFPEGGEHTVEAWLGAGIGV
jgi:cellobiose phosphorylase